MPALTAIQVQKSFDFIGAMFNISAKTTQASSDLQSLQMSLNSDCGQDYNLFNTVLVPFATSMKATITPLDKMSDTVIKWVNTYYAKVLAPQLNLAAGADLQTTLDALRANMTANGQYLNPTGKYVGYFVTLGYTNLPKSGTTAITEV